MTKSESQKVINNYVPHNGFFDLSNRPTEINDVEYAKILETQNFLAEQNKKFANKEVRKNNKHNWEQLKELSGNLQSIIFQHWNLADLN